MSSEFLLRFIQEPRWLAQFERLVMGQVKEVNFVSDDGTICRFSRKDKATDETAEIEDRWEVTRLIVYSTPPQS